MSRDFRYDTEAETNMRASSPVSELVEREAELRKRFSDAVTAWPSIAARVAAGQQFNEWEYASNGDDDEPDDLEYFIGIGPIGNLFSFQSVEGQRKANLIASALKLAAFVTSNPQPDRPTALAARDAEIERLREAVRDARSMLATVEVIDGEDGDPWSKAIDRMDAALSTPPQGAEHE